MSFIRTWSKVAVIWPAIALGVLPAIGAARADVADWIQPDFDRWFHQGSTTSGEKPDPSLFSSFEPGGGFSQARSGTLLLGFETAGPIPLVDPARYQINAIRFTSTLVDNGRIIFYDPTPDTIADVVAGGDDPGRPIELYGVGFSNDYDRLGFGSNDALPPEFEESSPLWPTAPLLDRAFNVFPLGDDGTGSNQLGNVFNSPGGEAIFALDPDNEPILVEVVRDRWDSQPWAIGIVDELSTTATRLVPGQAVPGNSVFSFDIDLSLAGVREYFQQSLSIGQVAVILSSLHDVDGFHDGQVTEDFPAFYAKEHLAVQFGIASASTLQIDYSILPERLAGDYDQSGAVNEDDYSRWRDDFGLAKSPGMGADGNIDGLVNLADYTIWRDNFGASDATMSNVQAIPEPTTLLLLVSGMIAIGSLSPWKRQPSRRPLHRIVVRSTDVRRSARSGFTLVELLMVVAVISILIAMLLPAIQSARESARRMSCMNNLKQIGLATHNFQNSTGHLPPPNMGATFEQLGSTFVALLPYLEESNLYAGYDRAKSVVHARNLSITGVAIPTYLCPTMDIPRAVPAVDCDEHLAPGSYMISTRTQYDSAQVARGGLDGAFARPQGDGRYDLNFKHFLDGTAKTLLVGEVNYGFQDFLWTDCAALAGAPKWGDHKWAEGYWALAWGHIYWELFESPYHYGAFNRRDRRVKDNASLRVFRSDHPGGVQFVFMDGSVHLLPDAIDYPILRALVTRAGGELDHEFP